MNVNKCLVCAQRRSSHSLHPTSVGTPMSTLVINEGTTATQSILSLALHNKFSIDCSERSLCPLVACDADRLDTTGHQLMHCQPVTN